MAYITKETVTKSPIDFAYIFVTKDYLSAIASAYSNAHAANIKSKYDNATRAINGWGKEQGMQYDAAKAEVRRLIEEQYGRSPESILVAWAKGEMVAGKDFKNGVYGVGETAQLTFAGDSSAKVDPATGSISFGSNTPEALWQTINNEGKTIEMNYTLGGKTFTSRYNPTTGQFIANTYGDKNGMYFANGATYTPNKASSTWENINTALPIVQSFVEWLANLSTDIVGKFVPITKENTVPVQADYYTTDNKGTTIAGFGIVGALLIGGLLLGSNKKKKG